jgi:hypothetical protein
MNDGDIGSISRIVLRPIGSPLPLGVLALVPAGVLMGVLQLGGIPVTETKTVALLLLGFVVPLQLIASVLSFLARARRSASSGPRS